MKSQSHSKKFHNYKRAGSTQLNFLLRDKSRAYGLKAPGSKLKAKVFVGLSGGVDSAVSAALLKRATPNNYNKLFGHPAPKGFKGYDVTGVFIKAWTPEGYPCSWREDRRSAMRAAAILDIPFLTLDLEEEYKREVVDYMIAEYKAGRTPNPDVMCNKKIKFGHFLEFALSNGADFIATGHYAMNAASSKQPVARKNIENFKNLMLDHSCSLLEGADPNKDQSYFLWTLTQKQLAHTLFPVGHLKKDEVRKLAKKFGLPQAVRKDSQGLCFLGKIDMKDFLKEYVGGRKGDVLNEKGEVIGMHNGAILYTIGERHGFTVTKKRDSDAPLYVVSKDIVNNTITVAPNTAKLNKQTNLQESASKKVRPSRAVRMHGESKENQGLFEKHSFTGFNSLEAEIKNINWISSKEPDLNKTYLCRVRYRQEKTLCRIIKPVDIKRLKKHSNILKNLRMISGNEKNEEKRRMIVRFDKPQIISSGQSLVLYDGGICLGGGVIC